MVLSKNEDGFLENGNEYDRESELKAFDDTKAGVKGLVDSGITTVPRIFDCRQFGFNANPQTGHNFSIPIIDFHGNHMDSTWHAEIVDKVRDASRNWGFFQAVNHGIPVGLLDDMINASRRFHEQDTEAKKEFYTRDMTKKVLYLSNLTLFSSPAANWRDSLACRVEMADPQELPAVCREVLVEYSKQVRKLAHTLLEIFSEALGLKPSYLNDTDIAEELLVANHYYPPCPEPELTIGITNHSDGDAVTILLKDNIGGLQILHENQWVDVVAIPGSLIVNIGDFLQLMSNDKFISANHRVLATREGPRISVASFFKPRYEIGSDSQVYGPIPELLSEESPPIYRHVKYSEFMENYVNRGLDGTSALAPFKL